MKKTIMVLASLIALPTFADWQLNTAESTINFTTIKKSHVAENHTFDAFNATISDQGKVTLSIDLASVNTNIAIRDERMQEFLFNTSVFPQALFNATIAPDLLHGLALGELKKLSLAGEISLHGETQKVEMAVLISRLGENKILVTSQAPLLIKASDFALVDGIAKLQQLAGLPSIGHTVPLVFSLSFEQ